ncbi:MAG: hypothetical protein KFW09_04350 [Oscillospiraceae bacterium]|nr:hypothetical protein [Oscillospiraceae bacterium]
MIKGVNKNIVEIKNTQNDYIERAIFFINPNFESVDEKKIIEQTKLYLDIFQKSKPDKQINYSKLLKGIKNNNKNNNKIFLLFLTTIIITIICTLSFITIL